MPRASSATTAKAPKVAKAVLAKTPAAKATKPVKAAEKLSKPTAPKKGTTAKTTAKKAAAKTAAAKKTKSVVAQDTARQHYVQIAAYYIAERRSFAPGDPLQDWLAAEAEVERLLSEGHITL